jgi:putative FmdB family regulatory protein
MPTYTYQCDDCGERFDTRQSFSEDPLEVCQLCETEGSVHRVIQATGIIFKGSGFYVTDNGKAKKSAANGSSSEASSEKKSATTGEGKKNKPASNSGPTSKTA